MPSISKNPWEKWGILERKRETGIRGQTGHFLSIKRHFSDTVRFWILFPELSLDLAPGGGPGR
jgi:hypothetical protein